jgi:hypothetical protein
LKAPSIVIPFSTARGAFVIDICIRKTREAEKESASYGVQNHKTKTEDPDARRREADAGAANRRPAAAEGASPPEADAGPVKRPDPPQTTADRIRLLRTRLSELVAAREAMSRQLAEKPFLEVDKRRLYKKNIPLFDARIKRLKLDISALEMLEKLTPDKLDNPTLSSHFQHYGRKK